MSQLQYTTLSRVDLSRLDCNWEQANLIDRAARDLYYGPYLQDMIDKANEWVDEQRVDGAILREALVLVASAYLHSSALYQQNPNRLSGQELVDFHSAVREGRSNDYMVPPGAETSVEMGIRQTEFADRLLTGRPPQVLRWLNALTYQRFTAKTMPVAMHTTAVTDVAEVAASGYDNMKHLMVTNHAIAQSVTGIARYCAQNGKTLRLVDLGSGSGSTLGPALVGIAGLPPEERPQLAVTGIDATPPLFDQLVDFARTSGTVQELNLQVTVGGDDQISRDGELTLVQDDLSTVIDHPWPANDNEIVVVTSNYCLHRIPQDVKTRLIASLAQHPNVVFLFGDLVQNTSGINRGNFNLGPNGPLNPGNRRLLASMRDAGVRVAGSSQAPGSLDPVLVDSLAERVRDDNVFVAGSRGDDAAAALALVSTRTAAVESPVAALGA